MHSLKISTNSPPTFFITDIEMLRHKCEWDENHIEKPKRLSAILDLFEEKGILKECEQLDSAKCTNEELLLVHSQRHIDQIREASSLPNLEEMEKFCANNEDIFVNSHSWDSALLSAGCALKAMEAVLKAQKLNPHPNLAPNAFAAIRPPGHHASQNEPCGFCLFNNVAICAKKARLMGVQRVLILDWDIHAGQGTQYCIEDDEGIKLISAHRFEQGHFWPELPESGILNKYKNTINVPLDEVGYGDAEYAAFMHLLVIPIIQQWKPELLLVSCGFDAALGDPEGEMEITPSGFGYMTGLLAQLGIPLCALLEGGYFIPSVAQSALHCLKALLQNGPPLLNFCQTHPSPIFLCTLYSVLIAHSNEFDDFNLVINLHNKYRLGKSTIFNPRKRRQMLPIQMVNIEYCGYRQVPIPNPTRNVYPSRESFQNYFGLRLQQLMAECENGQKERELLNIKIEKGNILLSSKNEDKIICKFKFKNRCEFLFIFNNLFMPLAFTYFDIHLNGMEIERMNLRELEQFIDYEENCGAAAGDSTLIKSLEIFIDKFPMMKHFFVF